MAKIEIGTAVRTIFGSWNSADFASGQLSGRPLFRQPLSGQIPTDEIKSLNPLSEYPGARTSDGRTAWAVATLSRGSVARHYCP
jgi:hypothetical protein